MRRPRAAPRLSIAKPDPEAAAPLYLQLADAIEKEIRGGHIRTGQRLAAERALAGELGLSRTTVTGAYQELEARGLVRGHVGRGTVVVGGPGELGHGAFPWAQRASALAAEGVQVACGTVSRGQDVIALDSGWPDQNLYPADTLSGLLAELGRVGASDLYDVVPRSGDPALREAVSQFLRSRGIRAPAETIFITSGAQQGLDVIARAFLGAGDVVVTETPTYPGALLAFRWTGAHVVGVPVDAQGIQIDALEEALARYRPKLIYVVPTFQNPTGALLSRERRRELLELALRFRVPVVESDVYGELYFDEPPPPRLKALDEAGVVLYQGSVSKIGMPGLRVGWLVAPPPALLPLAAAKAYQDLHTAPLLQRLVAAVLGAPSLERHLVAIRAGLRARRDALVAGLHEHAPGLEFRVPVGGYYLWARLPVPLAAEALQALTGEHALAVRPGSHFAPGGVGDRHIRLSFSRETPSRLAEGARRLGRALGEVEGRRAIRSGREVGAPVSVV